MANRKGKTKATAIPAKISPPRLSEKYARARLFRAIDLARRKRAVWISAPAGAGKTSVVVTYLAARRLASLWYNVDARDADVANLFHYLAAAARLASPRRKLTIPAFTPENQPGVAAFARNFFEALCRERPASSVIVLDDYHEARSELWDEVIREGLQALPTGLSVVIISRREPPASFARLIACGAIGILVPDDLRLTHNEMAGLVRLYRRDLRGKQAKARIDRVCELANGWAAALTLLLQERDIGASSAHGLAHCSELLFDYCATEILDKMTALERTFLLKTSVPRSFTAELAASLTGAADAAGILVELERRSFLTQRLGSSGAYRHHPLLREFLLRQAEKELGREVLRQLHQRAAESLVEAGLIDEAMEQFETAQDVSLRAQLILRAAPSYVASGRSRTVEMWIARLPRECVESDAWLSYWAAISCVDHAPSQARELLERAYALFAQDQDPAGLYRTCAAAIQAVVHEGTDFRRLDPWAERLDRMRVEGPACPDAFLPMSATGMLIACTFRPRGAAQGRYWAEQAFQLAMESDDVAHRVMTGGLLAFYFAMHGDAARASTILEMLRAAARATELSPLAVLTLLVSDAVCSWARGDNPHCISLVREGLDLAGRFGIFVWNVYLQTLGVAATVVSDNPAAAQEFVELMAQAAQTGPPFVVGGYHFNSSWEALVHGDATRAHLGAELARQCADRVGYPLAQCNADLALATALFQSCRAPEALDALGRARRHAEDIDSSYLLFGCDVIEADFLWEENREQALCCLRRGLAIARARNYHNMFCMSKSLMARTAGRALEHQIEPAYVRESVAKHRLTPDKAAAQLESWPWRYRLRAFGSLEIRRADDASTSVDVVRAGDRGEPLRGMPLRLLGAIVTFGARDVRDASLIDALWPDADGAAGRRVFDTTLHRLRRQLGDDHVLRLSDGRIGLDERFCWLDTWAIEGIFAEAARRVEAGAAAPVLVALSHRLLAIYRGPLLADDATATWAEGPRARLASKFGRAADELGRALEKHGEFRDAAALYERVLEGDDLAESAHAGLMRCAAGTGHHGDAIRLFEQYRGKLARAVHSAPGQELSDLLAKLSAETPRAATSVSGNRPTPPTHGNGTAERKPQRQGPAKPIT